MARTKSVFTYAYVKDGIIEWKTFQGMDELREGLKELDAPSAGQLFAGEPIPFAVSSEVTVRIGQKPKATRKPRAKRPKTADVVGVCVGHDADNGNPIIEMD